MFRHFLKMNYFVPYVTDSMRIRSTSGAAKIWFHASSLARIKISSALFCSVVAKPARKSRPKLADPIQLTERAAARIKELLEQKDNAIGVRIGVKRRGCNGYSYTINYVVAGEDQNKQDTTSSKERDEVVACHGVQVFVDPKAVFFIVGTEMDFIETDISSEFTFTNPNSKGQCGCGESFNV
jgi:iron-sulfur cluster assembly accessory protein